MRKTEGPKIVCVVGYQNMLTDYLQPLLQKLESVFPHLESQLALDLL